MQTFNKLSKLVFFLMISLMTLNSSRAALDSKGTDFWLMFDRNFDNIGVSLIIFITSDVNTSGTVEIPGIAFSVPYSVTANNITQVAIPSSVCVHTSDVIDNLGVHVTSLQEVTVYGLNRRPFSTDAYLGLPTDILGTDYYVLAWLNSFSTPENNNTQIGIVGTVNGTTVTITPTATVGVRPAGVPYNIVLNQGQTYEIRTSNALNADLTGTKITSTQPVGVMGTHSCANIPFGASACDHICEMLPPTTTWGQNFLTVPLRSRTNGDTWRFLASQNGTIVTINGVAQPVINAGQFINTILTTRSVISSDKPILVAQYANGSSFSGDPGDPFIMLIPPTEQFLANYTLGNLSGFVGNFINVVAPASIVGSLTLDGVPIPVVEFSPIGASGFSGAQVIVDSGSHTLNGTLPFGVYDYGFNSFDSYGYPGGLNLSPIATIASLDVTPENATNLINTQHCVDGLVLDNLGSPVVGVRVDFLIMGVNPGAGFAFTNAGGIAQFCYTGVNPGRDTIIGSTANFADTVFKLWEDDPLPVEMSSFISTTNGTQVTLTWSTSAETNNSGFDIERTAINGAWSKVGFVQGNGTTTETRNYNFVDRNLGSGTYNYRLKQIDFNGNFEYFNLSNEVIIGIPSKFNLSQNYPNPFNPTTKIDFQLPTDGKVKLSIYDNSGKLVSTITDGFRSAGYYTVEFNASNLSSGIYFYKLESNELNKVMKMTVIK